MHQRMQVSVVYFMKKKEEEITFLVYIMKLIVKENTESRMCIVDTYVQYVYLYY